MKKTATFILLTLLSCHLFCQQIAVITKTGKEVLLFENGTWSYVQDEKNENQDKVAIILSKPADSKFLLESKRINYGIWLNKSKWTYSETETEKGAPTEFTFGLKGEDAYGMTIAEKIEVQIDTLVNIAFQNAKDAAPDAKLVKDEWRKINGVNLRCLQMEGTISGIKFVYLGYYYSDSNGSLQFLTYTSANLLNRYKDEMEALLNGLVILYK
jgi:hypothetical protein